MRYKRVVCLAGPVLHTSKTAHRSPHQAGDVSCVEQIDVDSIDALLQDDWDIIRIVEHHDVERNRTGTMFVMGEPRRWHDFLTKPSSTSRTEQKAASA